MIQDLKDKVVLVTGASRGIGYQAAKETARRGAHVVAVARTVGGLEELDDEIQAAGGSTTLVPLDLRDGDGIDRLGAAIFDRWGKLDGLISNAAVLGVITPVPHLKQKDFDQAFAVNVTANYRLIRSLDLLLRQSDAGRAVFISSSSARSARAFWGLYAATKAALEALIKSYAAEVATTPLKVNAFYPGAVRTAMRAKAVPGEDPDTLPRPEVVVPKLVDMVTPGFAETRMVYDYEKSELRAL
jgi:NAD(P)-dependent dehydrogenase (short-subunit alcohol dehydrogenase family)